MGSLTVRSAIPATRRSRRPTAGPRAASRAVTPAGARRTSPAASLAARHGPAVTGAAVSCIRRSRLMPKAARGNVPMPATEATATARPSTTSRVAGGVVACDLTFNEETMTWHPHLHALMDSPWINWGEMRDTWQAITCHRQHCRHGRSSRCEGSWSVWVEAVSRDDPDAATRCHPRGPQVRGQAPRDRRTPWTPSGSVSTSGHPSSEARVWLRLAVPRPGRRGRTATRRTNSGPAGSAS